MLTSRTHFRSRELLTLGFLLSVSSLAQSTLRIEQFTQLPDGQAELVLTGATSPMYAIEATTNLVDWIALGEQAPQSVGEEMAALTILLTPEWPHTFLRVSDGLSSDQPVLDYAGTIGPAGGVISAHMGRVVLDFPPGAVSGDIHIRVSPVVNVGVPGVITPSTFDFGPDGEIFSAPVTLTLTYEEADLPDGIDEGSDLFILGTSHTTGEFVPVPGSVIDPDANTVSAPISGFSTHGIAIQCLPNRVLLPWCPPICTDPAPDSPDDPGGELDPSFGTDGLFTFELGLAGATGVDDLLIDDQGRLLLAVERTRMGVARILPDGEGLDPGFGVDGFAELSPSDPDNTPRSIALRTDGRILLHGAQQPPGGGLYLQIARFLPDGALDASFGEGGVLLELRDRVTVNGEVAMLPDGRIMVTDAGARSLFQYLPDGTPDPTFGVDGIATKPEFAARRILWRAATGGWLLATSGTAIRSATPEGGGGLLATRIQSVGTSFGIVTGFHEIPGAGYVIGGSQQVGSGLRTAFVAAASRFWPGEDGVLEPDPCFGVDEGEIASGARTYPFGGSELVNGSAVQADGRILLVGATTDRDDDDDLFVIRIRPDGEVDRGFGDDGIVYLDFGGDEQNGSVAIDEQGRIVVAGSSRVGNSTTGDRFGVVARLLP
jgi:uncharacterized delta-60 repeat protein